MAKYKKGTVAWALMNDDWSDLTPNQIAEVLDVRPDSIHSTLCRLRKEGIEIQYTRGTKGRKRDI